MSLFDDIKNQVDILDYITATAGGKVEGAGAGKHRVNPCPFCGHNDCFTVYKDAASFFCFSCSKGGDVIEYVRLRIGKNAAQIDAAKALARERGIDIPKEQPEQPGRHGQHGPDGRNGRQAGKPAPPTTDTDHSTPTTDTDHSTPTTDTDTAFTNTDRAYEIRAWAADYYHKVLMADAAALSYQTDVRMHSVETLKRFRIGWSPGGKGFMNAAREAGISDAELLECGLARNGKYGAWGAAGKNRYVYPNDMGGRTAFLMFRDPEKKNANQIKKDFAPDGFLCYGQDALDGETIVLVEGQDDRLTVIDRGGDNRVAATHGAWNQPAILAWIRRNAAGKTFFLCFDRDDSKEAAGAKYTVKYGAAVLDGGGKAFVVQVPEPHKDIDDVLKAADDPRSEWLRLQKEAEAFDPPDPGESPRQNPPPPGDDDGGHPLFHAFESFEILGILENKNIVIWSKVHRWVMDLSPRDFTFDMLMLNGGQEVFDLVCGSAKQAEKTGKAYFGTLKHRLLIQAAQNKLGRKQRLGRGVHALPSGRLLLVNGDRAWLWDGKALSPHEHPLIENLMIQWEPEEWVDMAATEKELAAMDRPRAESILEELIAIVKQWAFSGQYDALILSGWVVAQLLQSQWDWRPHMWMAGPTTTGKSQFNIFMSILWGHLALAVACGEKSSGTSEAGVRQAIRDKGTLAFIDEFEKSDNRDAIMYMMRVAGRGGWIVKGSVKGGDQDGNNEFYIRHMFFSASIDKTVRRAADMFRYLGVETMEDRSRNPVLPDVREAAALRARLTAMALWASRRALDLTRASEWRSAISARQLDAVAVPFSMVAACLDKPEQAMGELVKAYLEEWDRLVEAPAADDARLMEDILEAKIRVNIETDDSYGVNARSVYTEMTVGNMLFESAAAVNGYDSVLQTNGVKYCVRREDEGDPVFDGIFLNTSQVEKNLLKGTVWQGMDIGGILRRIPGAYSSRRRIAETILRGVVIPAEYFDVYRG